MNPNGTVPVLRDGADEPLWKTGTILRYLAARYGAASFWPPDGAVRAHVDKWAEWAKLNVALNFTAPVFWQVVRTAPADQDSRAIGAAFWSALRSGSPAAPSRGHASPASPRFR